MVIINVACYVPLDSCRLTLRDCIGLVLPGPTGSPYVDEMLSLLGVRPRSKVLARLSFLGETAPWLTNVASLEDVRRGMSGDVVRSVRLWLALDAVEWTRDPSRHRGKILRSGSPLVYLLARLPLGDAARGPATCCWWLRREAELLLLEKRPIDQVPGHLDRSVRAAAAKAVTRRRDLVGGRGHQH